MTAITPEAIIAYLVLGGAGVSIILLVAWLALYLRQVQLGNRRAKLEIRKLELEIWHLASHQIEGQHGHEAAGSVPLAKGRP